MIGNSDVVVYGYCGGFVNWLLTWLYWRDLDSLAVDRDRRLRFGFFHLFDTLGLDDTGFVARI